MKKVCLILSVIILILTFSSCKATGCPFSQPLTKWTTGVLELYVCENWYGYFLYKESDQKIVVFDAEFLPGGMLYIYKHREGEAEKIELVASYVLTAFSNEKRSKFNLQTLDDELYSAIFPKYLRFETAEKLTANDIEYEIHPFGQFPNIDENS